MAPVHRAGSSVILSTAHHPPWMAMFEHLPSELVRSDDIETIMKKMTGNASFPVVPAASPEKTAVPSCEPK